MDWPHQASVSLTISWSLPKFMFIVPVMPFSHLILCHPLFFLPWIFPSISVFTSELTLCVRWPKYWSFSISPSSEYSGLIYFRIEWMISLLSKGFVLAVQGIYTWLSAIPHPRIYVEKMIKVVCEDSVSGIFNTALFMIANYLMWPKYPVVEDLLNKWLHVL